MDFKFSAEHLLVQNTFTRLCDDRIIPSAAAIDEAHEFPFELFRELADM